MKTKTVHQSVIFKASPATVYRAIADARMHSKITGARAVISAKPGSRFSAFGGGLSGFTLDSVKNKRIVQAWRAEDWPTGHYSVVTFTFAKVRGGTRLTLDHIGVPPSDYKGVQQGWKSFYWRRMQELLV